MAKRRKATVRTVVKYRKARRPKKKPADKMAFLKGFIEPLSAVAYGYTRDKISDAIAKTEFAKKLPVSQYTDELVMYGVAWGSGKAGLNKVPIARSLVKVAKTIELGRVGQTFSDIQQAKKTTNNNGVVANNSMIVIG